MALTSLSDAAWRATFKNFGRLTMMRNIIGGDLPTFQSGVVITTRKLSNEDFALTTGMLPTFINNMNTLSSNMSSGKTNVDSSLSSLVTNPVKADITSTATTASGILQDVWTQMVVGEVTISGGGLFETMFGEVFGYLPHQIPTHKGMHKLPDTGTAIDVAIFEGYATFDWQSWPS
mgnify:FL=1